MVDKRESDTRDFYDRIYCTEEWRRPEDGDIPSKGSRFTKMWYRALLNYLEPLDCLRGKRVLEVGCGYGYLVPQLCSMGAEYVGVDISLSAVRQFPKSAYENSVAMVADGKHLPFADRTFDCVVCTEVFEHVTHPQVIVNECFRVARAGGVLAFSCPNYFGLFLVPKILADLGIPFFRRYMRRQIVDRTTTAFGLRSLLTSKGNIRLQRAVRLHPPFFEQIDYRLAEDSFLGRINDFIFWIERKWGGCPPINFLGLHTLCIVEPRTLALR